MFLIATAVLYCPSPSPSLNYFGLYVAVLAMYDCLRSSTLIIGFSVLLSKSYNAKSPEVLVYFSVVQFKTMVNAHCGITLLALACGAFPPLPFLLLLSEQFLCMSLPVADLPI